MKVAILADPLDNQSAGVHTYTKGLIETLLRREKLHEYILIREKKDPALPAGIRQVVIPNNRFLLLFAAVRMFVIIPLVLRLLRVDVVLEPAHFGPFNLPERIKRINIIHDLSPLILPQYHRLYSRLLQKWFLPSILKRANTIIAVSQHTAKDIARYFPFAKAKTAVIYPGLDPFYSPDTSKAVLAQYQINTPYFLYVGTIEPRKNLELLLGAYSKFRAQHKGRVLLVIVGGKGWKNEAFYKALEKHHFKKDIILTGYADKKALPGLYTHALAFVYPSLYEGFGLPVLEAMACGTQVICSDRASLPEVGGELAQYFNPEKEEQLLKQLLLCGSSRKKLVNANSKLIDHATSFSWQTSGLQFEQILQDMKQ